MSVVRSRASAPSSPALLPRKPGEKGARVSVSNGCIEGSPISASCQENIAAERSLRLYAMRTIVPCWAIIVVSLVLGVALCPARPPNIVMIISDDQTYTDLGFMGNTRVRTPNLDELARQSARYTHGYVPSSVCRPSLVTLLTGLYPHQHGVHFNHPPPGFSKLTRSPQIDKQKFDALRARGAALVADLPTLPRLLAGHGYRCLQTGKYWEGHWRNAGFTDGMTIAQPSGGKYGDKQLAGGDLVAHGNGDHGLSIGRETMQPIEDFLNEVGNDPFLVWYAPFLPHVPHDSAKKYYQLFESAPDVAEHELPYFAAIAQFDETVGSLVRSIEKRGLANQTLFVFVVDNGWQPDPTRYVPARREWDHTKHSKRAPFDAGLRTPILLRWDGQTKPATHTTPVSSVDLVPTLAAAAGLESSSISYAGENLWPSAIGDSELAPDRCVFGEIYPGDASVLGDPARDLAYRWVRRGRHKLIIPHSNDGKPPWNGYLTSPALYDVVSDPHESRDLMGQQDMAGIVADLRAHLDDWWSP
jgi:arylsulfatase A